MGQKYPYGIYMVSHSFDRSIFARFLLKIGFYRKTLFKAFKL